MRAPLAFVLLLCAAIAPAGAAGLYAGRTIVTGMDGRSRPEGLRRVLAQVLVKASGNAALLDDPRVAALDPTALLRSIAYLDRMSDQPKRDEQGSRDRPYDLIAAFDPAAIDAALLGLGETPWTAPRPVLLVQVTIAPRRGPSMELRADTDADERHRAALLEAAERAGIEIVVPASLDPLAPPPGATTLRGTLRWSDEDGGWVSRWSLDGREWGRAGGGFDAAYRDGLAGAAAVLSGHPPPSGVRRGLL